MARVNKRTEILEAIVRLIERSGITSVTLDAVAAETGLSRPGLLYHFPSREALLLATHTYLANEWDTELQAFAGESSDTASDAQRREAYITLSTRTARKVELQLILESSDDQQVGDLWRGVVDRWASPVPSEDSAAELDAFIARLAADGLWMHEALYTKPLSKALRKRIADRLIMLANTQDQEHSA